MKISRVLSLIISYAAMLHIVGLAAYIFDFIPVSMQSMYFYNLDRVYMLIMIALFHHRAVDKMEKNALLMSGLIYFSYFHIVNIKYIIHFSYELSRNLWIVFTGGSFIAILIYIYYVSRK